jgi:hypothetical protein
MTRKHSSILSEAELALKHALNSKRKATANVQSQRHGSSACLSNAARPLQRPSLARVREDWAELKLPRLKQMFNIGLS